MSYLSTYDVMRIKMLEEKNQQDKLKKASEKLSTKLSYGEWNSCYKEILSLNSSYIKNSEIINLYHKLVDNTPNISNTEEEKLYNGTLIILRSFLDQEYKVTNYVSSYSKYKVFKTKIVNF